MKRVNDYITKILSNRNTKVILICVVLIGISLSRIYMLKKEANQTDIFNLAVEVILAIVGGLLISILINFYRQVNRFGLKNVDFTVVLDKNNVLKTFIIFNLITIPLMLFLVNINLWI